MLKAVVFDMDGLLLDTEKLLVRFWMQAAKEAGFEMTKETALKLRSLHKSFAVPFLSGLFEGFDYEKVRARRMELMRGYLLQNPLELKKGARELLLFLREKGLRAAVCTATDRGRAEDYLGRVGILGLFDDVICASDVKTGKPAPDIYLYAADKLCAKPCECVALEDSPNGVRSAYSAGFLTIMVPDLSQPEKGLKFFRTAESLFEVKDIIEELISAGEDVRGKKVQTL